MSTFFNRILPHSFCSVALPLLLFLPTLGLNASLQHFSHERPDPYLSLSPLLALSFNACLSITHPPEQIPLKTFLQSSLIPPTVPPERQADLRRQLSYLVNTNREDTNVDQTGDTSKSLTLYSSIISGQYRIVLPQLDRNQLSITEKIVESVLDHELRLILSVLSLREISTFLYQSPASLTPAAGGGGGDDGDNNERFMEDFQPPDFIFFIYPKKQRTALQLTLKDILSSRLQHKLRLLTIIRRKLKYAEDDNLKKIYRDRIMVIQADCDDLESELRASYNSDAVNCLPVCYPELNQPLAYYLSQLTSVMPILPDELPGDVPETTKPTIKQQNGQPSQNQENTPNQKPDGHQPDEQDEQGDDKNGPPEKGKAPDRHTIEMSFIEKIEAFLDIPEEDFLEIGNSLKFHLFQNFLKFSQQGSETKKIMAKATFTWLKNRNREEARELFMRAYRSSQSEADNNFDPDDQMLAWLMIHKYKKLLDGTSEDAEADEQEWHNYAHRPIEQANPEVLPLLIFYYAGELSGIRRCIEIEVVMALIDKFEICNRDHHLLYFFPVSFTALDRIRWTPLDDTAWTSLDTTSLTYGETRFYYILIAFMSEWKGNEVSIDKYHTVFSDIRFYQEGFKLFKTLRTNDALQGHSEEWYNYVIQLCENFADKWSKQKSIDDKYISSASAYYQICAILEHKRNKQFKKKGKVHKLKVLNWYQKAAKLTPELWHRVFQEALKIGITSLIIQAVQQLGHFRSSRSPLIADYWEERLESLRSRSIEPIPESDQKAESTLPDWVLAEASASDKATSPAGSKKNRKGKKKKPIKTAKTTPTNQEQAQAQAQAENYDSDAETLAKTLSPMDIAALPGATIKVGKKQCNIADISRSDDQWQTKTSKKAIRPFERVFDKNWNEKVYGILENARTSRNANNPKGEYSLYLKFLKTTSNSMVGIERIWEEMGWLLLHPFDDVFAVQAVRDDLRKSVLDAAFKAKDNYFLPAIASYLGLDEMNSALSPEEFYKSVLSTLNNEHFDSTSQKVEFIHRLRCLASSVAHSFSLAVMASPRNKKLGELARSWYKAKRDLVTQEETLKIIQENQPE